jgi:hypothetical protein
MGATFEPNLNVAYFRLGRCAAYTVAPARFPIAREGIRSVRFRLFSPDDRLKTVVSKIAGFSAAEMIGARQRNRRTSARLMARGKHPVGVQMSHFCSVWRLGQSCPQVRVAATIAFSPGWVKADRRRSTMPDRGHSPGLGRRHGRTQAIHQPQPGDGVALLQSY